MQHSGQGNMPGVEGAANNPEWAGLLLAQALMTPNHDVASHDTAFPPHDSYTNNDTQPASQPHVMADDHPFDDGPNNFYDPALEHLMTPHQQQSDAAPDEELSNHDVPKLHADDHDARDGKNMNAGDEQKLLSRTEIIEDGSMIFALQWCFLTILCFLAVQIELIGEEFPSNSPAPHSKGAKKLGALAFENPGAKNASVFGDTVSERELKKIQRLEAAQFDSDVRRRASTDSPVFPAHDPTEEDV